MVGLPQDSHKAKKAKTFYDFKKPLKSASLERNGLGFHNFGICIAASQSVPFHCPSDLTSQSPAQGHAASKIHGNSLRFPAARRAKSWQKYGIIMNYSQWLDGLSFWVPGQSTSAGSGRWDPVTENWGQKEKRLRKICHIRMTCMKYHEIPLSFERNLGAPGAIQWISDEKIKRHAMMHNL